MLRAQYVSSGKIESEEMFSSFPELLTVDDMRLITGLSGQTIRAEIRSGNIPACKIGRRWFVPKTQFIAYIQGGSTR